VEDSPFIDRLFDLLDTNGDAVLDVQEFISGLALLCKGSPEEKLKRICSRLFLSLISFFFFLLKFVLKLMILMVMGGLVKMNYQRCLKWLGCLVLKRYRHKKKENLI